MTLISLIVVLLAERIATQSKFWQESFYTRFYFELLEKRHILKPNMTPAYFIAIVGVPTLFVFILLNQLDNALLRLVTDSAILMIFIGCPSLRATYKCYLQAANRGDFEACSLYADQLGHSGDSPSSFGQRLVWLNYQHYAAVIIWFAVLGPAGAVLYGLTRALNELRDSESDEATGFGQTVMHVLDWLPVRVTALGLLLVGHFSRAMPVWLNHFANPKTPANIVLCEVARAAEEIEPDEKDCTEEPCTLVRLAKRNVMFLVVIMSVLSLSGIVR